MPIVSPFAKALGLTTGPAFVLRVDDKKINEAFEYSKKGKMSKAQALYDEINQHYNNLKPEEKKLIYPRLMTLYSEILKK